MSTMYELLDNYRAVLEMASDPEIDPVAITDTLDAITGEIEVKSENSAVIVAELTAEAEKIKTEIDRLTNRKKSLEKNAAAIKERIYNAMIETGRTKFKTTLYSFNIKKNPPKLVIDNPDAVSEKYLIPQPPKIDNAAIKSDIAAGVPVEWAHIEHGESLTIR